MVPGATWVRWAGAVQASPEWTWGSEVAAVVVASPPTRGGPDVTWATTMGETGAMGMEWDQRMGKGTGMGMGMGRPPLGHKGTGTRARAITPPCTTSTTATALGPSPPCPPLRVPPRPRPCGTP